MKSNNCLLILVLMTGAAGAARDDVPTAKQLLDAAHKVSDLSALGSYVLTGQVAVDPGGKKASRGRLDIYRDGDRERVDVEIEGEKDSLLMLGRTTYYNPDRSLQTGIGTLDRYWDPQPAGLPEVFRVLYKFGEVKADKVGELQAWCMDRTAGVRKMRLCFDAARGVLLSQSDQVGQTEFMDFVASGPVLFPRKVVLRRTNSLPVEISQIEVNAKELGPETFAIPDDVMDFETCEKMTLPQATYQPEPDYPESARHAQLSRVVGINIIVTKGGKVGKAQLVRPMGDALDYNALNGVKKWRFKPASCAGHPVNTTVYVEVDFRTFK